MVSTGNGVQIKRADDAAVEFALDRAHHNLTTQAERLTDFRKRTTTLLGAATIGSSFLAGIRELETVAFNRYLGAAAILGFAGQMLFTIIVLFPVKGWVFSTSPRWLNIAVDRGVDAATIRLQLLRDSADESERNKQKIDRIGRFYTWALISFAVAVLCSAASIAVGG